MAAVAAALLSGDGTAPAWCADNRAATKCAATPSKRLARAVTTATPMTWMVVHTRVLWSAALYATVQSRKSAFQNVETGSLLVTRPATTKTRPMTMAAAVLAPRRPDWAALKRLTDRLAALRSVETA